MILYDSMSSFSVEIWRIIILYWRHCLKAVSYTHLDVYKRQAKGHVKALKKFEEKPEVRIYNLGTGIGYSVLDVLHAYEEACGKTLPYEIKPRRAGDIATCYCDATKAKEELGWAAEKGIKEMCADSWKWQSMNPDGYRTED